MSALLALVPWYWRWIALAALIAAAAAAGAFKMHQHDQVAYDNLVGDIKIERAEQAAVQAERKRLSDSLIAEKDAEHAKDLADADAYWAAYAAGLQPARDVGAGAQPVRIDAKICNDPARDHELSGAVEAARQDLGRAIAGYRAGLAPLLRAAEVQTGDLVNLQDAWAREKVINAAP